MVLLCISARTEYRQEGVCTGGRNDCCLWEIRPAAQVFLRVSTCIRSATKRYSAAVVFHYYSPPKRHTPPTSHSPFAPDNAEHTTSEEMNAFDSPVLGKKLVMPASRLVQARKKYLTPETIPAPYASFLPSQVAHTLLLTLIPPERFSPSCQFFRLLPRLDHVIIHFVVWLLDILFAPSLYQLCASSRGSRYTVESLEKPAPAERQHEHTRRGHQPNNRLGGA